MSVKNKTALPSEADHVKSDDFFDAVAKGDPKRAAHVLRRLNEFTSSELQLLADLISGDASKKFFPYRFELKKRAAGRPTEPLARGVAVFGLVRAIVRELERGLSLKQSVQLEAAIIIVAKKLKLSRSTVRRAWDEYPQKDIVFKRFTN
jgi:hypothetical protein